MSAKLPQRMCVACRQMKNKKELLRCRVTPEGTADVDDSGKKPGRGAYICAAPACIAKARKHDLLAKALGIPVGAAFYDELERHG